MSKLKMGHVTLTTPLLGVVCQCKLGYDAVDLCIKYKDSSISRSRDIIGAQKFKIGHMTLTMPLLRVISHAYAGA